MIQGMMRPMIQTMMQGMIRLGEVETIERRQMGNIPEFSHLSRSRLSQLYRQFLEASGVHADRITRQTRLRISALSTLTNISEEQIRAHMEPIKKAC